MWCSLTSLKFPRAAYKETRVATLFSYSRFIRRISVCTALGHSAHERIGIDYSFVGSREEILMKVRTFLSHVGWTAWRYGIQALSERFSLTWDGLCDVTEFTRTLLWLVRRILPIWRTVTYRLLDSKVTWFSASAILLWESSRWLRRQIQTCHSFRFLSKSFRFFSWN